MVALPFGKFFWSDYASDPALKICSFGAQGLWMRMLCIAAEHDPVGYVAVNGEGLNAEGIAALAGGRIEQVEELLSELERRGVFSRDRRGWIYSRRMVRDAKKARKARENGKKGGNPKLCNQTDNPPPDNQKDKGRDKPHIPEARVQSPESSTPNVESNSESQSDSARFAFFGRTIKVNARDLGTWRTRFHAIPDLEAELFSLDAWFETQDAKARKEWFWRTISALGRKHGEILERRANETRRGGGYDPNVITV